MPSYFSKSGIDVRNIAIFSRGTGLRMKIVRINENILVNADKSRPKKIRIVCNFHRRFFFFGALRVQGS